MAIYIDRIAIKDLLGIDELGIYGVAYRFAAVAFLVMVGFQQALSPLIFKYYTEKKTPSDISKIFNIFIIFALFVTAGSILFSKELVVLFVTKAYYSTESLIAILVMAFLFSNMFIFAPGIIIAKKTKLHAMINISAAIMNIILNYTLIPVFGLSGAAYATLISAASAFSLHIIFSYRYYPIPYHTKPILLSLLITLISGYGVLKMFDDIEFVSIIVKIIVLFLIFVSTGFFLLEKKYLQKIMLKLMMSRK
jgi:O-antigen/teichoic acid export membrane protein